MGVAKIQSERMNLTFKEPKIVKKCHFEIENGRIWKKYAITFNCFLNENGLKIFCNNNRLVLNVRNPIWENFINLETILADKIDQNLTPFIDKSSNISEEKLFSSFF